MKPHVEWDDQKAMAVAVLANCYNSLTMDRPRARNLEGRFAGDYGQLPDGRWAACVRWYDFAETHRNGWAAILVDTKEEAAKAVLTAAMCSKCEEVVAVESRPNSDD